MSERDSRKIVYNRVPTTLQDNEDYEVFLRLGEEIFSKTMEKADAFPDLTNPDKVPIQFLYDLAKLVGFKLHPTSQLDFNREAMMRILDVYRARGHENAVLQAANHGSNKDWVGGKIFVPGSKIDPETAEITYPSRQYFIHSKSEHSIRDRFYDARTWGHGMVYITAEYFDRQGIVKQKIREQLPAGVIAYFTYKITLAGENVQLTKPIWIWNPDTEGLKYPDGTTVSPDMVPTFPDGWKSPFIIFDTCLWVSEGEYGTVTFKDDKIGFDNLLIYYLTIEPTIYGEIFDVRRGLLSGKQIIWDYAEIRKEMRSTMLPHLIGDPDAGHNNDIEGPENQFPTDPVIPKARRGFPYRDDYTGIRSGSSIKMVLGNELSETIAEYCVLARVKELNLGRKRENNPSIIYKRDTTTITLEGLDVSQQATITTSVPVGGLPGAYDIISTNGTVILNTDIISLNGEGMEIRNLNGVDYVYIPLPGYTENILCTHYNTHFKQNLLEGNLPNDSIVYYEDALWIFSKRILSGMPFDEYLEWVKSEASIGRDIKVVLQLKEPKEATATFSNDLIPYIGNNKIFCEEGHLMSVTTDGEGFEKDAEDGIVLTVGRSARKDGYPMSGIEDWVKDALIKEKQVIPYDRVYEVSEVQYGNLYDPFKGHVEPVEITLEKKGIYGTKFSGNNPSGTRIEGSVGLSHGVWVQGSSVSYRNDFDKIQPFSSMKRCNVEEFNGDIQATFFEGEVGYSPLENVFVQIPKFYYYRDKEVTKISMTPEEGFSIPSKFVDYKGGVRDFAYIAAYPTLSGRSVPGESFDGVSGFDILDNIQYKRYIFDVCDSLHIGTLKDYELLQILMEVEFASRKAPSILGGKIAEEGILPIASGTSEDNNELIMLSFAKYAIQNTFLGEGMRANLFALKDGYELPVKVTAISVTDTSDFGWVNFETDTERTSESLQDFLSAYDSTGYGINIPPDNTGVTDNLSYSCCNLGIGQSAKYRGIENPFGNGVQLIGDAIILKDMTIEAFKNRKRFYPNNITNPNRRRKDVKALTYTFGMKNSADWTIYYNFPLEVDGRYPQIKLPCAEGTLNNENSSYLFKSIEDMNLLYAGGGDGMEMGFNNYIIDGINGYGYYYYRLSQL